MLMETFGFVDGPKSGPHHACMMRPVIKSGIVAVRRPIRDQLRPSIPRNCDRSSASVLTRADRMVRSSSVRWS